MLALRVNFLAGRFHATPWGHHVNEGAVEWPPSPWRLLRAIVASWKRTCADADVTVMSSVLRQLTAPPTFVLPPATIGHVRHFMPDTNAERHSSKHRDRVFDTFVSVSDAVTVVWGDVHLEEEVRLLLQRVVSRIPYLGRAEAWCDAQILSDVECAQLGPVLAGEPANGAYVSRPASTVSDFGGGEFVRVLTPKTWTEGAPVVGDHPLLIDTATLRRSIRQMDPPGARWVLYEKPPPLIEGARSERRRAALPATAFRYAISEAFVGSSDDDQRKRVLRPLVQDTVLVAEAVRAALLSCYGRANGGATSGVLSGHVDGIPAQDHRHARYLPTDEDRDGRLDHVTVISSGGFDEKELDALRRVKTVTMKGGRAYRFIPLGDALSTELEADVPMVGRGIEWISASPFVLSRHPRRGKDGPAEQLLRELEHLGLPRPEFVKEVTPREASLKVASWQMFQRWRRRGGPQPAIATGFGFLIRFAETVRGPVAVGYGSHFGLGLFVPRSSRDSSS